MQNLNKPRLSTKGKNIIALLLLIVVIVLANGCSGASDHNTVTCGSSAVFNADTQRFVGGNKNAV